MRVLSGAGLFTAPGAGSGVHWVEPHTEDEIYVVTAGQATLEAGGQAAAVGPGSVIYVPAGEPHHFTGITSDLAALVLFAPAEYSRAADGR
jgi:quercetin dioxygenase-like cupin family protein